MFKGLLLFAMAYFFIALKNLISYLYWRTGCVHTIGIVGELQREEEFGYPRKTEYLYAVTYNDNGQEKSGTIRSIDLHLKTGSEVEMLIDTKAPNYFKTKEDFLELKYSAIKSAKIFAITFPAAIVLGIIGGLIFG